MTDRVLLRALGPAVLLASCSADAPSASLAWVRWLSFVDLGDVAVSPSGERILLHGVDAGDRREPSHSRASRTPTVLELDHDGTIRNEAPITVAGAIDDDGIRYGVVRRSPEPEAPDAAPLPAPGQCELVAEDAEGDERFSVVIRDTLDGSCPRRVFPFDDVVVVVDGISLVGISPSGDVRWRVDAPPGSSDPVARQGALWLEASRSIVRCDPTDGGLDIVALDDVVGFATLLDVDATHFYVSLCPHAAPGSPCDTAAFDHSGHPVWSLRTESSLVEPVVGLVGSPRGTWQVSTSTNGNGSGDGTRATHVVLEHLDAHGRRDATLRRAFVENPDDAADTIQCAASDNALVAVDGSSADGLERLADGRLLLWGRQGCRDAFVAAIEVTP